MCSAHTALKGESTALACIMFPQSEHHGCHQCTLVGHLANWCCSTQLASSKTGTFKRVLPPVASGNAALETRQSSNFTLCYASRPSAEEGSSEQSLI